MNMFELYGPCDLFIEKLKDQRIIRDDIFWPRHKKLHDCIGCYIFALSLPKKPKVVPRYSDPKKFITYDYKPYLVGSSTKNFRHDCFKKQDLKYYHEILPKGGIRKPVMFFLIHPQKNPDETVLKEIDELKVFLINTGRVINFSVRDVDDDSPSWGIKGVIRKDRSPGGAKAVRVFKNMMGFDKVKK